MVLKPDNYEFPFEVCVPKGTPESIQGVDDCFIRYILRAQIYGNGGNNLSISREVQMRKAYTMSLFRELSVSFGSNISNFYHG